MPVGPTPRRTSGIRHAMRLWIVPLGIAMAAWVVVPTATAKVERVRNCGHIPFLGPDLPARVQVTVGRVRGILYRDVPCRTARYVGKRCLDHRSSKGWRCIAAPNDPNAAVLVKVRGVGLPRGQGKLVTVLIG
jgi:hypothetical protein